MANETRDPRKDPRPGDAVRMSNETRTINLVMPGIGASVARVAWRSPWNKAICKLSTWRRWARKGEVVARGE